MFVLAILAILSACYFARDVLVPIVFAVLLTLVLRPLLRRLRKYQLPDGLSALLLIAVVAALFLGGVLTLAGQAQTWLAEAPSTVRKVGQMLPTHSGPIEDFRQATAAVEDLAQPAQDAEPLQVQVQSQDMAFALLGVSSHFVAASVVVFVLGYFLLACSDTLLKQALAAQSSFGNKRNVVAVVQNVEQGVSRYLLTITVINIALGLATAAAMWLLGIPNPLLWGVLATIANYVPHVGAFGCMVVLFFVGAVTHQSLAAGTAVAGTFVVLTSAESYFLTPFVLSKRLQLSPVAVLLAILFWGWLWGIGGGLIAAPLLTVIKIACDQIDSLRGVAVLLSGEATEPVANDRPLVGNDAASRPLESAAG
jgi:predicted PurR-regulated permease PerM